MRTRFAFLLVVFGTGVASAQKADPHASPLPLPFNIGGDGHACAGFLHVTPDRFVWRSSFSTCQSASWRSFKEGKGWVFVLQDPKLGKNCGMPVVQMEKPAEWASEWIVTGYRSLADMRQKSPKPELSCELM